MGTGAASRADRATWQRQGARENRCSAFGLEAQPDANALVCGRAASVKPVELRRITEITGVEYGREELRSVEQLIARADSIASLQEDESVYSAFAAAFRAFVGALDRTGTRRG